MISRHFALSSELTGAIAKRLPHAKNQLSAPGSFFNQFVTDIYIYIRIYVYIHKQTNNNRVLIVRVSMYDRQGRINRFSGYVLTFFGVVLLKHND